jgi:hypothetical protein
MGTELLGSDIFTIGRKEAWKTLTAHLEGTDV